MCQPTFFTVSYEINPWMKNQINTVDHAKAVTQWQQLKKTIESCGATVVEITPQPQLPDMVFTANAALIYHNKAYPASFAFKERQGERPYFMNWLTQQGLTLIDAPGEKPHFEGAGDALFAGDTLFAATGFRTEKAAYAVAEQLGDNITIVPCTLVDPYFYHLDTCFCPLNETQALWWPEAFDAPSQKRLQQHIDCIAVSETDAKHFACNAVVINQQVILPAHCNTTATTLESLGFVVHHCDMSEYLKAGGACKCLTLKVA